VGSRDKEVANGAESMEPWMLPYFAMARMEGRVVVKAMTSSSRMAPSGKTNSSIHTFGFGHGNLSFGTSV
jgi:hypothetical protein